MRERPEMQLLDFREKETTLKFKGLKKVFSFMNLIYTFWILKNSEAFKEIQICKKECKWKRHVSYLGVLT